MSDCSVYCHISPSGKKYVGITSQPVVDRWRSGKGYKCSWLFDRAIRKYGWDSFEHVVLYEGVNKEFAMAKEIELIKKWETTNPKKGYNLQPGGHLHSPQTKKKIGEAHTGEKNYFFGKKRSPEYCKNMSERLKGRTFTAEHKRRLSESQFGEKNHQHGTKWNDERRAQRSHDYSGEKNPNYGNKMSEEQKRALSERFKGVYRGRYTDEMRARMSGKNSPTARAVRCNGIIYDTVNECARAIGISVTTLCPYLTGSRKMPQKYKDMGVEYVTPNAC